jgi:TolB-like protein/DNA-binding SARP family transcriptional activator
MLRLLTFGGLSLEADDGRRGLLDGQRKALALLVLVAHAGARGVARDRLLALLWPESSQERARGALKQMLHGMRRDLGEERLTLGTTELRLDPDVVSWDAAELEQALAGDDLEAAVALYRGPFLDGFHLAGVPEFERWLDEERARLARRAAGALETLAARAAAAGDHAAAAQWWRRLAAMDPFATRAALGLMAALHAAGDRAAALQHARIHETLVREELGAPPDPAVSALAEEIRNAPAPPARPLVVAADVAPAQAQVTHGAAVTEADDHATPARRRRLRTPALAAAAVLVLAAAVLLARAALARPDAPAGAAVARDSVPAIAVLPFVDMSPEHDAEYFSDGISEELINALTAVEGLRVVSRTSSFAFKGKNADIGEIGRRLGAHYVLEGSVRTAEDQLRITAQLISVADGYHLWSKIYERRLGDVFAVQEEISRAIVDTLKVALGGAPETRLARAPADLEAYRLFLQGRYWFNSREPDALERAAQFYRQAIARDPSFAAAHAGLAESLSMLAAMSRVPPGAAMPAARQAALRALELDPQLSAAHAALGHVQTWYEWDWDGAEASFRRALELSPGNGAARHWYSVHLGTLGRFDEAVAQNERAIELDPAAVLLRTTLGIRRYLARDDARALEEFRAALELAPGNGPALVWSGVVQAKLGRPAPALAAADSGYRAAPWPMLGAWRAYAYALAGRRADALAQVRALEQAPHEQYLLPSVVARVYIALDQPDRAFEWLERAYRERDGWLSYVRTDPAFDPVRSDARFGELLRRMKLE